MVKKIFNWSLCLAIGGLMMVSCRQDIENVELETTQEEAVLHADDYAAYVNDPRTRACRIVTPDRGTDPRGAAITMNLWQPGQTITVSFIGGTTFVRQKVQEYAKKWEEFANIKFQFVASNGNIRVSFIPGAGSYSQNGTAALTRPANLETMNFGWFDSSTPDSEFSKTVLHEFGHALGLIHEHQHPEVTLNWNKEFAYFYYGLYPNNWSKLMVDRNLFQIYKTSALTYNDYDVNSIMHYPIAGTLINSLLPTPTNTVLSDGDKEFIGELYPF